MLNSSDNVALLRHAKEIFEKVTKRRVTDKLATQPIPPPTRAWSVVRGPFTMVVLDDVDVGFAKFNPNDCNYSVLTGLSIATQRAILDRLGLVDNEMND